MVIIGVRCSVPRPNVMFNVAPASMTSIVCHAPAGTITVAPAQSST